MTKSPFPFIFPDNLPTEHRDGYAYQRHVDHRDAGEPFNFLKITVTGRHPTRRVTAGIRNYYVVSGTGEFSVTHHCCQVEPGTLITIRPGQLYSYQSDKGVVMELIEFNVDVGDGISHEEIGDK